MKKKLLITSIILAFIVPIMVSATGVQEERALDDELPVDELLFGSQAQLAGMRDVKTIMDFPVTDGQGKEIGRLTDMLIELSNGYVTYFVIKFNEGIAPQDQAYPIPFTHVLPNTVDKQLEFDIENPEFLEYAPTMADYPSGPAINYPNWDTKVHRFWSKSNSVIASSRAPRRIVLLHRRGVYSTNFYSYRTGIGLSATALTPLSSVKGKVLFDTNGKKVGLIQNAIINLKNGLLAYVLVSLPNEKTLYPVPLALFIHDRQNHQLKLSVSAARFNSAPRFPMDDRPDFTSSQWNDCVRGYWRRIDINAAFQIGAEVGSAQLFNLSRLFNYTIINGYNQTLGEVEDFTIAHDGSIPYGLLNLDTVQDLDRRWALIPTNALDINPYRKVAFLDMGGRPLRDMPRFNYEDLPISIESGWDKETCRFWNESLAQAAGKQELAEYHDKFEGCSGGALLSTNIMEEYQVQTRAGTSLGRIRDIVIDADKSQVAYVIMEIGHPIVSEKKEIALSYTLFRWSPVDDKFILDVSPGDLKNAPGYASQQWPQFPAPEWQQKVDEYWEKNM